MSERDQSVGQEQEQAHAVGAEPATGQLEQLMQKPRAAPDLDQQALAAAELALAQGQQALAEARSYIERSTVPMRRRPGLELALRVLLAVNLLAMAVVLLLPSPGPVAPAGPQPAPDTNPRNAVPQPAPPSLEDPVLRAFAAADRRDYRDAIRLLEGHLAGSPGLLPAKKANILLALEHYAAQIGDFAKAQEYQRRAEALRTSHSLPEDLLQMALEAERNGDVESMRRQYARLLLQQRQVPSALTRRVAEAYLKLGDSYRLEAEQAAAAARERELEELRAQLRLQAATTGERPEERGR